MDQLRIENLGRIMRLLSGNISYTVQQLADKLDVSVRTIYRYIDTLKNAGFEIVSIQKTIFRLKDLPLSWVGNGNVFYFTDQEVDLLKAMIVCLDRDNPLKKGLRKKLGTVKDDSNSWFQAVKSSNTENLQQLAAAVENKRQVILIDYDSLNSDSIRNRHIEPYSFTSDLAYVWAYDLEDNKNKLFKISRIGSVILMDHNWENDRQHHRDVTDVFGFAMRTPMPLLMKMTNKAKRLLVEQYPRTDALVEQTDGGWILKTEVGDYTAPKSFCAGLGGEVELVTA